MIPKPGFIDEFEHPRIAWFVLEGVALCAIGAVLWLAGRVASPAVATLGEIAFLVGLMTAVFGSIGYLVVSYTT